MGGNPWFLVAVVHHSSVVRTLDPEKEWPEGQGGVRAPARRL